VILSASAGTARRRAAAWPCRPRPGAVSCSWSRSAALGRAGGPGPARGLAGGRWAGAQGSGRGSGPVEPSRRLAADAAVRRAGLAWSHLRRCPRTPC